LFFSTLESPGAEEFLDLSPVVESPENLEKKRINIFIYHNSFFLFFFPFFLGLSRLEALGLKNFSSYRPDILELNTRVSSFFF
jgi:hypothetical protein